MDTRTSALATKTGLFFKALAGESIEARCSGCESVERVILLDSSNSEGVLAEYRCGSCDLADAALDS
jgi:hypothetical protein